MSLYAAALKRAADHMAAQLAMLSRHQACIDRIESIAKILTAAGLSARAAISPTNSLMIIISESEKSEAIHQIERTGHQVFMDPAPPNGLILAPDHIDNALPATLIVER